MFCFQSCIFTNRSISRKFCRKKNSNRSLERAFRALSLANELKPWLDISKVHFELLGISRLVLSLYIRLGLKAYGLCRNLSLYKQWSYYPSSPGFWARTMGASLSRQRPDVDDDVDRSLKNADGQSDSRSQRYSRASSSTWSLYMWRWIKTKLFGLQPATGFD